MKSEIELNGETVEKTTWRSRGVCNLILGKHIYRISLYLCAFFACLLHLFSFDFFSLPRLCSLFASFSSVHFSSLLHFLQPSPLCFIPVRSLPLIRSPHLFVVVVVASLPDILSFLPLLLLYFFSICFFLRCLIYDIDVCFSSFPFSLAPV